LSVNTVVFAYTKKIFYPFRFIDVFADSSQLRTGKWKLNTIKTTEPGRIYTK